MTVVLAVAAALLFGTGVALQQRAALEVPTAHALRPRLLIALIRRPLWLGGLGCEIGGFALQAAALANGSLVAVQPILTVDLVFTLAIGAAWARRRLSRRDWLGVGSTVVGMAVFLLAVNPDRHSRDVGDTKGWLLCVTWIVLITAAAAALGAASGGARRAAYFGVAAGVANGFMAVLIKTLADELDQGVGSALRSWPLYAVVGAGIVAMLLMQSAYQADHPTVALPVINVVDPLVSSLIGVTLFNEHVSLGGGNAVLIGAAAALISFGMISLARTPIVLGQYAALPEART